MKKTIVFTDLDGTLLDASTYSFDKALPALALLKELNIPLVISSSKTRKEIEFYRNKLGNNHPFISENGGGIYIPKGYFDSGHFDSQLAFFHKDDYSVIQLGASYDELRNGLDELRKNGFRVTGFGDMTTEEIARTTGLSTGETLMAQEREYDEPFIFEGDEDKLQILLQKIIEMGLNYTKGRFFHLIGDSDKGRAVSILTKMYRRKLGDITTIAIGDCVNDIPMLRIVDYPLAVKKTNGTYISCPTITHLARADGAGPEGWNNIVTKTILSLDKNADA